MRTWNVSPGNGEQALADDTERTRHGFTQEQLAFLFETLAPRTEPGFDRSTLLWLIGILVAIALAVSGFIWAELHSLRSGFGSIRTELVSLREEIRENGAAIAELAKGQARIEAILEERLPRGP